MIFSAAMVSPAKRLRAPAIIGQRHQRAQRRQVAHVGAEIAFKSPERGDHRRRHAIFLFGARKRRRISLDMRLALLHPVGRGHAAGKLGEHLAEYALAAIAIDDALVVDEIGRGLADRALRNAGRNRLLFQFGQKAIETRAVMATGCTRNGCCSRRSGKARCDRSGPAPLLRTSQARLRRAGTGVSSIAASQIPVGFASRGLH